MSVKIEWLNTLTTATEYRVYRNSVSGTAGTLIATLPAGSTEYTDAAPLTNENYYTISGLVDGEEIFGAQLHVIGGDNWDIADLNAVTGTTSYEYDVSQSGTMQNDSAGAVTDGDLTAHINRTDAVTAGRLATTLSAQMPIYRSNNATAWLEFDGVDDIYTDQSNTNDGIMENKHSSLFSINMTPLDVATHGLVVAPNVIFDFDRVGDESYFKLEMLGTNTSGGFKLRTQSQRNSTITDPFLTFDDTTTRPNYTPITVWMDWNGGNIKVYRGFEKVIDSTYSIIESNTESGSASVMRFMGNTACRFYGMVISSRASAGYQEGEVNSLISYMMRKFHGRT
jgi:hypothetical protein